jgi:hypothetical protein
MREKDSAKVPYHLAVACTIKKKPLPNKRRGFFILLRVDRNSRNVF